MFKELILLLCKRLQFCPLISSISAFSLKKNIRNFATIFSNSLFKDSEERNPCIVLTSARVVRDNNPKGANLKMRVVFTHKYRQAYRQLSHQMQKIVDGKIDQLRTNPAHPSLQVHRHRRVRSVWICYINRGIRLLFQSTGGCIYLQNIGDHSIEDHISVAQFPCEQTQSKSS